MYRFEARKDKQLVYFAPTIHMNYKDHDYKLGWYDNRTPIYTEVGAGALTYDQQISLTTSKYDLVDGSSYKNVSIRKIFDWKTIAYYWKNYGIYSSDMINAEYPIDILLQQMQYLASVKVGITINNKYGAEAQILKHFTKNIALENVDDQYRLALLMRNSKSAPKMAKYIKKRINQSSDSWRADFITLFDIFNKGRSLDELEKVQKDGMSFLTDSFYVKIIHDRNYAMYKTFTSLISKEYTPVSILAVGAGHYGGKDGLINIFKKDGWVIKRVK